MRRRAEITVETEQIVIFNRAGQRKNFWCPNCAATVPMLTPEKAALLIGSSMRDVCRQVEAGQWHFCETADGRLFICLNSLTSYQNSQQGEPL